MPNDEFMLDVTGDGLVNEKSVKMNDDDVDGLEKEMDDFFDFVVIDKDMLEAKPKKLEVAPSKIEEEEATMKAGTSTNLLAS